MANVINIRNVDAVAVAKIDLLAAKKGISRNAYLKRYIEIMAIAGDVKIINDNYSSLVETFSYALEFTNDKLNDLIYLLELYSY